jgi:hypothetical protein
MTDSLTSWRSWGLWKAFFTSPHDPPSKNLTGQSYSTVPDSSSSKQQQQQQPEFAADLQLHLLQYEKY